MSNDILALGNEISLGGRRFVLTTVLDDGTLVLIPIPEGMTVMDLGRKFFRAPLTLAWAPSSDEPSGTAH